MFRKSGVAVVALALSLTAALACGGAETGQQQPAAGQTAAAQPAAQPTQMAQSQEMAGHEMEGQEMEGHAMGDEQQQAKLPEGVTQEMINQGKSLFVGAGLCSVCHGPEGKGVPNLGANLADAEWVHSDGSLAGISKTIMEGVDASKSTTGAAMPAKGGSGITDEQVKAVAAYVYSISKRSK